MTTVIATDGLIGSPFHEEYLRLNPKSDNFPALVEKVKRSDAHAPRRPPAADRRGVSGRPHAREGVT